MKFSTQNLASFFLIASLASLSLASSASAQNALGNGDALDANLSTSGRFNSPRQQEDFRQRNNIVTGNVAGGRGFRGSVGYTAERDFRGTTGSDTFFNFLADSAWSDPQVYTFGQRYDQLRFGQNMGILQYDRPSTVPANSLGGPSPVITSPDLSLAAAKMRINQFTISQTQVEQENAAYQPRWVSGTQDQKGNKFIFAASPARGFTYEYVDSISAIPGLTMMDRARLEQDREKEKDKANDNTPPSPVGANFETRFDNMVTDTRADVSNDKDAFAGAVNNSYKKILQQVADQYAQQQQQNGPESAAPGTDNKNPDQVKPKPSDTSTEELQKRYEAWRKRLQNNGAPANTPDRTNPTGMSDTGLENTQDSGNTKPKPGTDTNPGNDLTSQLDDFSKMLSHNQVIDRYSADHPDRFNELLLTGGSQLRGAQYFQAERTFMRALQITPDHPMAMAGMAHAQLGAGVFATASATLRTLFTNHPEMIDARYSPALLPSEKNLKNAITALQAAINNGENLLDNGLVVAYLGRLTNDKSVVESGIAAMKKSTPDDALASVLDTLWLRSPDASAPATPEAKPEEQPGAQTGAESGN